MPWYGDNNNASSDNTYVMNSVGQRCYRDLVWRWAGISTEAWWSYWACVISKQARNSRETKAELAYTLHALIVSCSQYSLFSQYYNFVLFCFIMVRHYHKHTQYLVWWIVIIHIMWAWLLVSSTSREDWSCYYMHGAAPIMQYMAASTQFNPLSQQIIIYLWAKLYVLMSSGMCVW